MASVDPTSLATHAIGTPVGDLTVVTSERGVREIRWGREGDGGSRPEPKAREHVERAVSQLGEYFRGERREFDLALDLAGTEFQQLVWGALARIPFGETSSYGVIAGEVGRPTAARAVGAATGRNPAPVIVPCHRVLGANGSLTGFAGGLDAKRALLAHEAEVAGAGGERRLPGF